MNPMHQGLICLLRSAVTGEKLPLPEGFSLEAASGLIRAQGLETLVYAGALNCGVDRQMPAMQKLFMQYLRHTLRAEQQMQAVAEVMKVFSENDIDYLPLKGCVMKALYPRGELRVMGDADILIRMEQYERITALVEDMGYSLKRTGQHEYEWRNSALVLELHRYIISPSEKDLFAFLGTGWDRAVREEGNRFALSPEDSWVFLFAHMAKHYRNTGIGSRHMVDLYMFRRAYPDLDEGYLTDAMEKLGLLEFHRNILHLLDNWFADGPADAVTEFITEYVFSGGSFGLLENGVYTEAVRAGAAGSAIRGSRTGALLRKIFPTGSSFENQYPILKKCPALYPVLWIYRWLLVLVKRPGRIAGKLRMAAQTTDEKVLARRRALQFVGLSLTACESAQCAEKTDSEEKLPKGAEETE